MKKEDMSILGTWKFQEISRICKEVLDEVEELKMDVVAITDEDAGDTVKNEFHGEIFGTLGI